MNSNRIHKKGMAGRQIGLFLIGCFLLLAGGARAEEQKYVMSLSSDWRVAGDLPEKALLLSLQGVVNREKPQLYFLYPKDWDFKFSAPLLKYYETSRGMHFQTLSTVDEAVHLLGRKARGYVVWDPKAPTTLVVAFTIAGLTHSLVVTEALIPLMRQYQLPLKADLRKKFRGKSDYEINRWAYQRFWKQCSRKYLVMLGGQRGKVMKPGIADFGVLKGAFFTNLSTDPADSQEYRLAKKIFSEMPPLSMIMGWHVYGKDSEAQYVTLASHYALRVEGLHTLPNMSFNHQIPLSPGYKFHNHHNIQPNKRYIPQKKVYIAFIQTDCLGLGAWTEPGRGDIPYAWEVTMNWYWLAPAMLQFFYDEATPNDYFIGSLSGPGYMYPQAIPAKWRPLVIQKAYTLMKKLDLNAFETMEHSRYWQSDGVNDDLSRQVVSDYFKGMPGAIGFANGYRPAHTFAVQNGRPFLSFDYYLSEKRDEKEAVADLQELANLNAKRPYFLLVHVREWSDIERVKRILNQLGQDFQLVPLDVFFKLAGTEPTFKTRFAGEY